MSFAGTTWPGSSEAQERWQSPQSPRTATITGRALRNLQMQVPWEDTAPQSRCNLIRDNSWEELGIHRKLQKATGTVNSREDHADTLKAKRILSLHKYPSQGAPPRFPPESTDIHGVYTLPLAFSTSLLQAEHVFEVVYNKLPKIVPLFHFLMRKDSIRP